MNTELTQGTGGIFGPVAARNFTDRLYIEYQAEGMEIPRNMIRMEHGTGDSYQFDILGKIMVQSAPASGGFPSAQNISLRARLIRPNQYTSYEPLGEDQQMRISKDTIPDRAMAHAWAHRRNEEQKIIEALNSDAGHEIGADLLDDFPANPSIVALTQAQQEHMSVYKAFIAKTLLSANNVGGEKMILLDHYMLHDFMNDPHMFNRDTSPIYTLATGMVGKWLDFTLYPVSNREEGGMPVSDSGIHKAIAFNGNAIGMFVRMDLQARIERMGQGRFGTEISTYYSFGLGIIQKEGIVHINGTTGFDIDSDFAFSTS